jgi:hypothetical protein
MPGRVVFLLEEPSMQALLDGLLPRLVNGWVTNRHFLCIPHEGKTDLDRSIARKLAAWRIPGDRFVIVRDNDGADCLAVKQRLQGLCETAGRPDTLVRLVCQELESWYLGDLRALAEAFGEPKADTAARRKRYSRPDEWLKASTEVRRLIPAFQKIGGARLMAQALEPNRSRSKSFHVFVLAVRRLAMDLMHPAAGA